MAGYVRIGLLPTQFGLREMIDGYSKCESLLFVIAYELFFAPPQSLHVVCPERAIWLG